MPECGWMSWTRENLLTFSGPKLNGLQKHKTQKNEENIFTDLTIQQNKTCRKKTRQIQEVLQEVKTNNQAPLTEITGAKFMA